MKIPSVIFFLFLSLFTSITTAQDETVASSLDTIAGDSARMDYLESIINTEWRSNPSKIINYSKIYDSIAQLEGSELHKAKSLNIQGMARYVAQEYDQAITFYLQSVHILEQLDVTEKLPQIYSNVAACYNIRGDFENTEKYFKIALDFAQQIESEVWDANINNNLSVLYMQNEMYDKADVCIANALSYFSKKKDSIMMGITYMNSGNSKVFGEHYADAIEAYTISKNLIKKPQFPLVHAVSNTGIGISLTEQKKYAEALPYLKDGLKIAKDIRHFEQMMESYKALANYYSQTENFEEAYLLSLESQNLKDSVLTEQQDANLAEALTKFETEKKETELKLLGVENEKNKQQQRRYLYLAIGGLLMTGLIGVLYMKNRKKEKLLAKQKKLLEATVDEKNLLLKETHHRVKNSFQMVSSLLYIQSETAQGKEAKIAIKEAQNRVRSMVLIHQKLYSKDQLVGIDAKEYFEDFTKDVIESHQFENNKIQFKVTAEPMVLDIETITPIGLILNELITNVLKHAFPTVTPASHVDIHFRRENNTLMLLVKDNGVGMPSEIKESSFGLELIRALCEKLKAELTMLPGQPTGTTAQVIISRFTIL